MHSSNSIAIIALSAVLVTAAPSQSQTLPPELVERLEKEKAARKGCKLEICKALAAPAPGAPVSCDIVRTWQRDEITSRVVGGSYVWGYGHVRCSFKVNLDRAEIAKLRSGEAGKAKLSEHTMTCDVDDKDYAKGKSFSFTAQVNPTIDYDKRKATGVSLDPMKVEGSTLASAAVTSLQAIDKVSGVISKTGASEFNALMYARCKEDGVDVPE
jgi:hypothetical protein